MFGTADRFVKDHRTCVFPDVPIAHSTVILLLEYLHHPIGLFPGTSFPNFWASLVMARQGRGGMAVANALGRGIEFVMTEKHRPIFVIIWSLLESLLVLE